MRDKMSREGLLPEAADSTEEEKRFNEFLLSNFRFDEEDVLILRDLALGVSPFPAALSENSRQRVIKNVLDLIKGRSQKEYTIGAMLAQYRQRRGVGLKEQAQELGIGPEVVRELETEPTPAGSVLGDNKIIGNLAQKYRLAFWKLLSLIRDASAFLSLQGEVKVPSVSYARATGRLEEEEHRALIDKVLQSTIKKGPENAMEH